jgi:hypothetical protein
MNYFGKLAGNINNTINNTLNNVTGTGGGSSREIREMKDNNNNK